ncbi:MAG TPA: hypothetical protein PKM58_00090 [Pyrinomonadaceae bacterium]|nr:hypothetical protein [Pyrinomonadaceae bacterium]
MKDGKPVPAPDGRILNRRRATASADEPVRAEVTGTERLAGLAGCLAEKHELATACGREGTDALGTKLRPAPVGF